MRIALTQRQYEINSIVHDCLDPRWYKFFSPHDVVSIPNVDGMNIRLDSMIDILVITGGGETKSRSRTEHTVFAQAVKRGIPILGVCHGAFFINYLYDGINAPLEGHREVEHLIFMGEQVFEVNSYHDMGIYELGEDLKPTAFTKNNEIEAFKHKELPIWGILWHPERMKNPVLPPLFLKILREGQ